MPFWEIKQSTAPKTIDLYIYSDVVGDYVDWSGETVESETSSNTFQKKIDGYGELDNINIYINSFGGSCKEGHAIYNILMRNKAYKTVYVDGFACSVASIIAMAGNKVVMPKNTVMVVHEAWNYVGGNADKLRKEADALDVMNSAFINAYLNKAGNKVTKEQVAKLLKEETTLSAEQCVEIGFADEFAEYDVDMNEAKEALEKASKENTNQRMASLDKVAALVKKIPEQPEEKGPEENQAFNVFDRCIKAILQLNAK